MIIIFPEKIFCKKIHKIIRNTNKGYCILDATVDYEKFDTSDNERPMAQFKNKMSMDVLTPRKETLNKKNFTGRTVAQLMKEFFSSYEFLRCANSIMYHQGMYPDVNIYIVYSKVIYEAHGKNIAKELQKIADCDQQIVFTYDQVFKNKEILTKNIEETDLLKERSRKTLRKIYKRKLKISKSAEVDDMIFDKKSTTASDKKVMKHMRDIYGGDWK